MRVKDGSDLFVEGRGRGGYGSAEGAEESACIPGHPNQVTSLVYGEVYFVGFLL